MAHSQAVAAKSIEAVERARREVNGLKGHIQQLLRSESQADQNHARQFQKHAQQAEALVEKAESAVKRVKNVSRIPPRPTASVPPAVRAKRSLDVLLAGLGEAAAGGTVELKQEPKLDNVTERRVKVKLEYKPAQFLSMAGKTVATPLREDEFANTLIKVAKETELSVARMGSRGVAFVCRNVFRAFMWFKEADTPPQSASRSSSPPPTYIVPEHISCFGIDESSANRWSCSRYAVFNVITERANAAIRYYMAREKTGEAAFMCLARWLARHKTLFSSKCEDRRLAFDASRGIFLPSCVYPFEGNGPPRFTRGSIPLRSSSSYSSQPTVRVPSGGAVTQSAASNPAQQVANSSAPATATVSGASSAPTAPVSRSATNPVPAASSAAPQTRHPSASGVSAGQAPPPEMRITSSKPRT